MSVMSDQVSRRPKGRGRYAIDYIPDPALFKAVMFALRHHARGDYASDREHPRSRILRCQCSRRRALHWPGRGHMRTDGAAAVEERNCVVGGMTNYGNPRQPPGAAEGATRCGRQCRWKDSNESALPSAAKLCRIETGGFSPARVASAITGQTEASPSENKARSQTKSSSFTWSRRTNKGTRAAGRTAS